ncbi:response regulator transcription factor [Serratia sp. BNK-17]|nr:LuxR family transcriptional regulator [Serratia marcescens]MDX7541490.1 LuxR C-terminal-related transcriptional regulator [Serratia marcescens]
MVNISLLVKDFYFMRGLRFFLSDYFMALGKESVFVREEQLNNADVILYESSNRMSHFVGKTLLSSSKDIIVLSFCRDWNSSSTWRLSPFQQTVTKKVSQQELRFYLDTLWHKRELSIRKTQKLSLENELTHRQQQIMRLLAKGLTPAEISMRLNISIKTISSHRGAVMKKFGFNRKIELYNWLILRGNDI